VSIDLNNKKSSFVGFRKRLWRNKMNKSVFASIVLRAAIVLALPTQAAWAAGNNSAADHATAKANAGVSECVRAPNVGAFASAPYTVPPCLPR